MTFVCVSLLSADLPSSLLSFAVLPALSSNAAHIRRLCRNTSFSLYSLSPVQDRVLSDGWYDTRSCMFLPTFTLTYLEDSNRNAARRRDNRPRDRAWNACASDALWLCVSIWNWKGLLSQNLLYKAVTGKGSDVFPPQLIPLLPISANWPSIRFPL